MVELAALCIIIAIGVPLAIMAAYIACSVVYWILYGIVQTIAALAMAPFLLIGAIYRGLAAVCKKGYALVRKVNK